MKSNLDEYAESGTLERKIIDQHFKGKPPSTIDFELHLLDGQARRTVIAYWAFDKASHYRHHVRKRTDVASGLVNV